VFREAVELAKPKRNYALQIFATDLDRDAIEKARQGVFPANIAADVSDQRLRRFFAREERGYRVRKEIREMVIFAPQNLIMDPPFTKLDLLICRNLLIYLTAEVQKKLIPLFHYSLNPGGILFLGSAETIGGCNDLFTPISGKARIFKRTMAALPEPIEFPATFSTRSTSGIEIRQNPKPTVSLQTSADQLVLHQYAPPAVIVNDKADIFYISGRTGKYLEPAAGKANWNLFAMAREGLRNELAAAFQKALRQQKCVRIHGLKLGGSGGKQLVDISVHRIEQPGPLCGLVIVLFTDAPVSPVTKKTGKPPKANPHSGLAEVELELLKARSEARDTHEEMQTSQEELRSTNE
jgi:hypothetical protein